MRTQEEIVARVDKIEGEDVLGFETADLVECLTLENARRFLRESPNTWNQASAADDAVIARLKDYMPFAWSKANDCRGLSAVRSLQHLRAWLWLLGEDDAAAALDGYDRYGKPQLAAACDHYGVDWRALDDGRWVDEEDSPHLGVEVAKLPWRAG